MAVIDRLTTGRGSLPTLGGCALRSVFGLAGAAVALACGGCAIQGQGVVTASVMAVSADAPAGVILAGRESAPERTAGAIRIATYNIENLFDDKDDPRLTGRFDDYSNRDLDQRSKPSEHRKAVARAIRAIDADVLSLQEIESYDALVEFVAQELPDMGYEHIYTVDVGQERGIQQAVISRFPVREIRAWPNLDLGGVHPDLYGTRPNQYAGQPLQYRRSPLFARVQVPATEDQEAYELGIYAVHHKSGRYNGYWREAEAKALVGIVRGQQRLEPNLNIAIMGDFNDTPDSAAMKIYGSAGLIDTGAHRSEEVEFVTHASGRVIDFILVNGALKSEVVEGSYFVLGTPVRPSDQDYRTTPAPEGYAADHMPVVVDVMPVEG